MSDEYFSFNRNFSQDFEIESGKNQVEISDVHFSNQVKEDSSWNSIPAKLIENSLVVMVT